MKNIKVSAPGKLHLLGEHAIVYNKPAILTAVSKRCYVSVFPRKDKNINVSSKNFNKDLTLSFDKVVKKFEKAQNDWDKYDKENDIPLLKSITKDPLDYPFIIIGQFIKHYGLKSLPGFDLLIDSEVPVGAGMGSSGALSVSVIGALSLFTGKNLDKKTINEIAFLCEKKKHGKPSGGDNSTSCYGGLVWFKKDDGIKPMEMKMSEDITKNFYIINTGTPTESTGEMVSNVRKLVEENELLTKEIFDRQEELVKDLRLAIEKNIPRQIPGIIKRGEKNLEKIGVVSDYVKKIIRDIEKSGGAAKICGAGGTMKATGIILIYHTDLQKLKEVLKSHQLDPSQVTLGVEGLREEK